MRKIGLFVMVYFTILQTAYATSYELTSPDGKLQSIIAVTDSITFTLLDEGQVILQPSTIGWEWMQENKKLKVKGVKRLSENKVVPSPFYRKKSVDDSYNQLILTLTTGIKIEFRMYDDGLAYRFVSSLKGKRQVKHEKAAYRLPKNYNAWAPYVRDRKKTKNATRHQLFWTDMQNLYTHLPLQQFKREQQNALFFSPLLIDLGNGKKLCLAEADVENYPGMYLEPSVDVPLLESVFAPYPKTVEQGGHNMLEHLVTEHEDYIAQVDGPRSFPWRTFIVTRRDGDLLESDMVYRLAAPARVEDISWIKPGKVAWEWWNNCGLYGVDFKAGINNETYKYYIDFASQQGIEYVILDEGWATKYKCDLLDVVPEIDLQQLVDYGKEKGVGIILWAGYLAMERGLDTAVEHYAKMGVKGFKIDFLNRDDQQMIDFMYRTAEICSKHKMLVDFHGCCKPSGMQRTYPNVVNYEAVMGLEQMKWSKPGVVDMVSYDVLLPYIRMVAGPMDYTQGAMRNSVKDKYYPNYNAPMSQGTRCRQLAEYVVFDSPLNMLCDSPSNYMREKECTQFISEIPTVWDETRVLDGRVGEYIVVARRKGDDWYIGALTNWEARAVTFTLPESCRGRMMEVFSDGVNADRCAEDYKRSVLKVNNEEITVSLASGGGWAAHIK